MTTFIAPISRFVLLAGLAYLGFSVFGIVMGVFAPGEMLVFGAIALVVVAATAVHAARMHRAVEDSDTRHERMREAHRQRERRGF